MVDKYATKKYVAEIIGNEYIIPTLGVWDKPERIEWDKLPKQFVLKTTHGGGGGGIIICRDKDTFDKASAIEKLNKSLKQDIYKDFREWPYKHVPRRIIAEKYMEETKEKHKNYINTTSQTGNLHDYKFYCFNGAPRLCQVISDRAINEKIDFYDMNWNKLEKMIGLICPTDHISNSNDTIPCPLSFEKMKNCAHLLSQNIPFSRIDFYDISGHTYFGEITFYPASGLGSFYPIEWNKKIGDWINLPL